MAHGKVRRLGAESAVPPAIAAQLVTSTSSSAYNGVDDINHLGILAGVLVYKVVAWARVARVLVMQRSLLQQRTGPTLASPHPDHCASSPSAGTENIYVFYTKGNCFNMRG